jgi:hypothetical protein
MANEREPDESRLKAARDVVSSFLVKKKRSATLLLILTMAAETIFLAAMLVCMDFSSRLHWFLFFGFMFIYAPLILSSWHNAVKIDHLYYRLLDELKYKEQ